MVDNYRLRVFITPGIKIKRDAVQNGREGSRDPVETLQEVHRPQFNSGDQIKLDDVRNVRGVYVSNI